MRYGVWAIAAFIVLGGLLSVANVGKERKPTTGGDAAFIVLVSAAIAVVLVLAGLDL